MQEQMEIELITAFRQLDAEFKAIALTSLKGQAARCAARKPILRLVSSRSEDAIGDGIGTISGGA